MKEIKIFIFIAVLISLTLFVSCGMLPPDVDYVDFTVTAENRHMVGYTGEENEDLVIPATFEYGEVWYQVIEIGEYAFSRANNLVEVVIPDSVTKIGAWAFFDCKGLRRVVIGNGVKEICEQAFADCTNLKSVIIPKSVEKMGDKVFYDDSKLTIYCEAKQRPSGWSKEWNSQKYPVVWGYEGDSDVEIEN